MSRNPQIFTIRMSAKRLPPALVAAAQRLVHRSLGFDRFNAIYRSLPPCAPAEYPRLFLDAIQVRTEYSGLTSESIPSSGPLIVIANHRFGLVDGMSLDALLLSRRPDATAMAMHRLSVIPEFKARFIFVDPEQGRHRHSFNPRGLRQAFQWLAQGHAMLMFPAGRVARFQWRRTAIADLPWSTHVGGLARRTGAHVLPVYFHDRNGWLSQIVGALWLQVHDVFLLREADGMRGRTLRATVGRLFSQAPTVMAFFVTASSPRKLMSSTPLPFESASALPAANRTTLSGFSRQKRSMAPDSVFV